MNYLIILIYVCIAFQAYKYLSNSEKREKLLKLIDFKELFFSFNGRLNRLDFLILSFLSTTLLTYSISYPSQYLGLNELSFQVFGVNIFISNLVYNAIFVWIYIVMFSKRLHDIGKPAKRFIAVFILITITTVIVMNLINNVAGEDVVMTNIFIFLISVLVLLISMLFMFYYFVMGLLKSGDEKQNQYGEPRQIIGHIYSR
jgi:uncharacterized membrane protein YhaH (DUF805 family)